MFNSLHWVWIMWLIIFFKFQIHHNVDDSLENYWFRLLFWEWAQFFIFLYIGYVLAMRTISFYRGNFTELCSPKKCFNLEKHMDLRLWTDSDCCIIICTLILCLSILVHWLPFYLLFSHRWTFRSEGLAPRFSVLPTTKSKGEKMLLPIYSIASVFACLSSLKYVLHVRIV